MVCRIQINKIGHCSHCQQSSDHRLQIYRITVTSIQDILYLVFQKALFFLIGVITISIQQILAIEQFIIYSIRRLYTFSQSTALIHISGFCPADDILPCLNLLTGHVLCDQLCYANSMQYTKPAVNLPIRIASICTDICFRYLFLL